MEFIQKKTIDGAVEYFLLKAAESEISLTWDRYEGQLPECGFCETGLSCRDCLQGPCISHPFRDTNKIGVCGKDKDLLATQSLLRLAIKGTMAFLTPLSDFAKGVESKKVKPKNQGETASILKEVQNLYGVGAGWGKKEFPKALTLCWEEIGIFPEGIAMDLFKASQKLEGGMADVEEIFFWIFKTSLLGCMAQRLQGSLKRAVFGSHPPTKVEVNLGILKKEIPNILFCGTFSPILKQKIGEAAKKKGINVMGVCSDPFIPPFCFPPVTNYGSQEIPLMTGAVDLVVAGDQWVNPSLLNIAKEWELPIVSTEGLKREKDLDGFAKDIVERAKKSFDFRRSIPRDIPEIKDNAMMGFSAETIDIKKIAGALNKGTIKGIILLAGSNNVKYTQDHEMAIMAEEFLKNDVLCISKGEASVALAKHGFLNPFQNQRELGKGLSDLLLSLGKDIPSVLDFSGEDGGIIDFIVSIAKVGKKNLRGFPIAACFPEANRSSEVTEALWTVAMGISTFFWPCLPLTGSLKAMDTLSKICKEKFGSGFHIITDKKLEPRAKANGVMKSLFSEPVSRLSGFPWK